MCDSTKSGMDLKTKKEVREEITVEEEELFLQKGLLGQVSAECLLHTIYFYCGKLFGTFEIFQYYFERKFHYFR